MTPKKMSRGRFDRPTYEEATARLRALKSRLPTDAVVSLAEEVIRRSAVLAKAAQDALDQELQPDRIEMLANALVSDDADAALHLVEELVAEGTSVEDIYLVYLAAAAQRLGVWWEQDRLSFADVTVGTSRIYGILRSLDSNRDANAISQDKRSAVFASVPGETHVVGIRMAADLFRRRGWQIDLLVGLSHDDLVEWVGESSNVIIGLSAGGEHAIATLAKLVLAIRIHKPGVRIFVGGQAVEQSPDLVAAVSPDGMAANFEEAIKVMDRLWDEVTEKAG